MQNYQQDVPYLTTGHAAHVDVGSQICTSELVVSHAQTVPWVFNDCMRLGVHRSSDALADVH